MNTEMKIFETEIKDIQELQAKARKYDELKVAVGKIKEELNLYFHNVYRDLPKNMINNHYKQYETIVKIIDKHTEGLI